MLDLLLDLFVTAGAVAGWLLLLLHLAGNAGRYVDEFEAARAARRRHEQFVLVDRWRAEFTASTWRRVPAPALIAHVDPTRGATCRCKAGTCLHRGRVGCCPVDRCYLDGLGTPRLEVSR